MSSTPTPSPTARAKRVVEQTASRVVGSTLDTAVSSGRKMQRLGWKAEKQLDRGVQAMRRHPVKTATCALVGVALLVSLVALSRRPRAS